MDNTSTIIGKDVIESLTFAMYDDARFVFREYIQNSADQIDKAVSIGLIDSIKDGKIEIQINNTTKSIIVYDNATGIKTSEVQPILKNIAHSTKDRTKDKGFRGIGRLGGLAYCDRLIFETSYQGESIKSKLIWNSKKLNSIINNRSYKEEATEVIDEVTSFATEKEDEDLHYFRVTLENVNNEDILDEHEVYQYLRMVAPVPYEKGFIFKSIITEKARELECKIDEYQIFVNNNQVFKAYTTSIYEGDSKNKKRIDQVHDIETYEIRTSRNKLLAWGWYSISSLIKQMPSVNIARSLRIRKGNIQIGLEDTLDKLFKDSRWSKYYFGEVYVASPDLIPNARRDYFLENTDLKELEKQLKLKFLELQRLNYYSSNIRSKLREIDKFVVFSKEYNEKFEKGFTNKEEKENYEEKFRVIKEKVEVAKKDLERIQKSSSLPSESKIFEKLTESSRSNIKNNTVRSPEKTKYLTDNISKLNRKEKKLVSKIMSIIDTVLVKDLAENLKEKIIEELK